ncbi:MAG TPA: 4Fe-4S dicluster domain-containing protein [Spirochaetia bacterium]|nr:4Fe-4S dicluster domain-containing protein [Spirochaetia bacterium]
MVRITFRTDLCKGCGLCAEFCPRRIITRRDEFNALGFLPFEVDPGGECTGCGACALMCPEVAIEIGDAENGGVAV